MADLMTDVYTYDELANKYGNFHVPAIRLYVNNKEVVQDMSLNVISAEIALSLSAASMATIHIDALYSMEKRSFDSGIKNKFKPGTIVEVGIGYGSEVTVILKGFVTSLGVAFTGQPCLIVTIMDVRRLMMQSGTHDANYHVENYSEAVKDILEKYSKFCKVKIDPTNDKLKEPLAQDTTDYDFIVQQLAESGRTGREFFVLADTAYFRKPRKEKRPIMKLEYGRELLQFQMEISYTNLKIEVCGYNQWEQKSITADAEAKSKEKQSSLTTVMPVSCISDPEADTQEKAKIRAEALADAQLRAGQRGRGTCIGLPEIVPGRFIEVVKLEEMVNKKYYVTDVHHSIGGGGFRTSFEIGGWI